MAESKPKPSSPFTGRWRIVPMTAWDESFIDEEEEGYFEFSETGGGRDQGDWKKIPQAG